MWEQATTRANELGSMVLWCDGGSTGVSGIGGGGIREPMQSGGGSWMRTIGIPYPVDENRTLYARVGDFLVVAVLVALMGGGVGSGFVLRWTKRGVDGLVTEGRGALERVPFVRRMIASGGEGEALL